MNLLEIFKRQLTSSGASASNSTVKNYIADVSHFIKWYETSMKSTFEASKINSDIIYLYAKSMCGIIENLNVKIETQLGAASVKRHISSLRKFNQVLLQQGLIVENPFDKIATSTTETPTDYWHIRGFSDYLLSGSTSKITVKNYISDIQSFAKWYEQAILPGVEKPLSENGGFYLINQEVLSAYRDRLTTVQNAAPRTVNRKLSSLRKYLDFATKKGFITPFELTLNPLSIYESKIQDLASPILTLGDINSLRFTNKKSLSPFPPLRLAQRLIVFPYLSFEEKSASIIASIIAGKPVDGIQKLPSNVVRQLNSKNLLRAQNLTIGALTGAGNIKKEFFAPQMVTLLGLPLHKKLIHHAKFTRPNWYHKYHDVAFVHYAHFALLIIFASGVGVALYQNLIVKKQPTFAAPTSPPRILSFQGRLTDNLDNPITSPQRLRFMIYNNASSTGAAELWEESRNIVPDQDGIFSILLGSNAAGANATTCGTFPPGSPYNTECLIPSTVFSDNSQIWLGVTIGSTAELAPRQKIASVAYATNSEFLQGMQPITSLGVGEAKVNTILALNASGNLIIDGTSNPSPIFQATGGSFTLSGNTLLLTTVLGTNSNVVLSPDGLGKINLQKPLVNTTTMGNIVPGGVEVNDKFGVLATESAVAAFVVNNNTTGGDIITASSSGTTRFTIGNDGTITSSIYTGQNGVIYGTQTTGVLTQATTASSGLCLQSSASNPTWANCGGINLWNLTLGSIKPINDTLDLLIGGQTTDSAKFRFLNNNTGTPIASVSANLGNNASFMSGDGSFGTTNRQTLTIGNSSLYNTSGNLLINPNGVGRIGIGTTNPLASFDLRGNSGTQVAASISANTSFAALLVDNAGTGDFITASKGGQIYFRVNANSGTWLGDPYDGELIVGKNGNGKITAAVIDPYVVVNQKTTGTKTLTLQTLGATNADILFLNQSTELSRFTQAGQLQLPITGSGAGISIGGDTQLFRGAADRIDFASGDSLNLVNGSLLTAGTTRIDSSGNGTFTNLNVTGSCTGCSSTPSPFQVLSGAIVPYNSTLDFILGAQSTSSAKFAVLNINGGTPTASVSATDVANLPGLYMSGTGTLSSVNKGTLTVGGSDTGFITIDSGSNVLNLADNTLQISGSAPIITATTTNANVQLNSNGVGTLTLNSGATGNIQFFSSTNTISSAGALTVAGNATVNGTTIQLGNGSAGTIQTTSNQTLTLSAGSGTLNLNTVSNGVVTTGNGLTTLGGNLTVAGATTTFSNVSPVITTGTNTNLVIIPNGSGRLGINAASPLASVDFRANSVSGGTIAVASVSGTTAFAGFVIDNSGLGDIFTASTGGVPKFTIRNNGSLTSSHYRIAGGIFYADGSGNFLQSTAGSLNECLKSSGGGAPSWGACGSGGDSFWSQNLGLLYPGNTTMDLAIGGTASSAAKFLFANVNSGNPTLKIFNTAMSQSLNLFHDGTNGNIVSTTGMVNIGQGGGTLYLETDLKNDTTNFGGSVKIADKFLVQGTETAGTALAVFDNLGAGDLITASASGVPRFTVKNDGNASSSAGFTIDGAGALQSTRNQTLTIGGNTTGFINIDSNSGQINLLDNVSFSGSTISDTVDGVDINDALEVSGLITANGGLTVPSGQATTLASFTNTGGVLYNSNGSGLIAHTNAGTVGDCLTYTTVPIWGSCTAAGSNWQVANGAIFPKTASVLDFFIGGTSTASANFAVLSVEGSATPVASVSAQNAAGQALTLSGDGTIQSVGNNTLTLGGTTTGEISIGTDAKARRIFIGNETGASSLELDSGTGSILIGNAIAKTITLGNITGATAVNINTGTAGSTITTTGIGDFTVASGDDVTINGAGADALINIGTAGVAHTITLGNLTGATAVNINAGTSGSTITTTGVGDFTIASGDDVNINGAGADALINIGTTAVAHTITLGNVTGATAINLDSGTAGVNIGDNATTKAIDIGGVTNSGTDTISIGTNATAADTLAIGNSHASTLLTLTGGDDWSIANTGTLVMNGNTTLGNAGADLLTILGSSGGSITLSDASFTTCTALTTVANKLTCGTASTGGGSNWVLSSANGTLSPINNTLDLLIGNTASDAAEFAVRGIAAGTNPTASVSATVGSNLGNGIVIAGDGSIQSLRNNNLTIGGNTTGNILFAPLNNIGNGSVLIGPVPSTGLHSNLFVNGDFGGKALVTFNTTSSTQNIFTASASGTTRLVLKSNGKLGLGTENPDGETYDIGNPFGSNRLVIADENGSNSDIAIKVSGGGYGAFHFVKSRGTLAAPTDALTGDTLGMIDFNGSLASSNRLGAQIYAKVEGAGQSGIIPSSLYFTTGTPTDGAMKTRLQIDSTGKVGIGNAAPVSHLDVSRPMGSGNYPATGKALVIFNQSENQDIFTASSSGITRFTIANDGKINIGTAQGPSGSQNSFTAKFNLWSDFGTTPAASISARTSGPSLLVSNEGVGDLIVASVGGMTKFRLFKDVTDLTNEITLTLGENGMGKINALNYDPPYTIDGKRYSTYAPSTFLPTEEFTGKSVLTYDARAGAYAQKLDFNNFEYESDLWVFNRIIDPDVSLVKVFMTPNSSAKTWYKKDGFNRTITLYSDRPTEVSYRLTTYRVDHKSYATVNPNGPSGLIVPPPPNPNGSNSNDNNFVSDPYFESLTINEQNGNWYLKNSNGNAINQTEAFSKTIIAYIKAGYINAQKIVVGDFRATTAWIGNLSGNTLTFVQGSFSRITSSVSNLGNATASTFAVAANTMTIGGQDIRDYIIATIQNSQLSIFNPDLITPLAKIDEVKTNVISPLTDTSAPSLEFENSKLKIKNSSQTVAWFDNQGNASFSGQLTSDSIRTNSASVSGTLATGNLETGNASVGGTLRANNIIANNIDLSDEALAKLEGDLNTNQKLATLAAGLANNNQSSYSTASGQFSSINSQLVNAGTVMADFGIFEQGITSMGPITSTDITAMDTLAVGSNFTISSNAINTIASDLALQSLRQANITFQGGLIKMDTDGNMEIAGNLNILGEIDAVFGVFSGTLTTPALATSLISPLPGGDLSIKLTDDTSSISGKLKITGSQGKEVLSVNSKGDIIASGAATLSKLNFSLVGEAYASSLSEAVASGSAGFATLRSGQPEITIKNPNVTSKSLIYITPFGDTNNKVMYLLRQVPHTDSDEGSFTVGISGPTTPTNIQFNWLIVN